jgi:hypothetical protein
LGEYLKTPLETPYWVVWVDTQIPIPTMVDEMDDTEIAELCETLTDRELDLLILWGHPLAQRCIDLEILDEILEEQEEEEERIEEEVRKEIEEADYEKVTEKEDRMITEEIIREAEELEKEEEQEECCIIETEVR